MEVSLVVHCGLDGAHFLTVDDMVITNWVEVVGNDECGAMPVVIPTIMDELLKWRANWRTRPDYDEFQNIHDRLSPAPAIFSARRAVGL